MAQEKAVQFVVRTRRHGVYAECNEAPPHSDTPRRTFKQVSHCQAEQLRQIGNCHFHTCKLAHFLQAVVLLPRIYAIRQVYIVRYSPVRRKPSL